MNVALRSPRCSRWATSAAKQSGVKPMDMVERVALYDLSALKEVVG